MKVPSVARGNKARATARRRRLSFAEFPSEIPRRTEAAGEEEAEAEAEEEEEQDPRA